MEKFIRAIFVVGTGSNVEIANYLKTKKTAQTSRDMSYGSSSATHTGEPSSVILIPVPHQTDSGTDDAADAPETATGHQRNCYAAGRGNHHRDQAGTSKKALLGAVFTQVFQYVAEGYRFYTGFPVCSRRLFRHF